MDINLKINLFDNRILRLQKNEFRKVQDNKYCIIYGMNSPDFKIYGKNDRFSSEIYGASKAGVINKIFFSSFC